MNSTRLQEIIDKTYLELDAYLAASTALAAGGIQSYTIDTGQTRQVVTKLDLEWMQDTINSLLNRCTTLEARLTGSGVSVVRPCF